MTPPEKQAEYERVNVQGTGHNPGPLTDMSETLLVRTSEWREVRIDQRFMLE